MLKINIPSREFFDEKTQMFFTVKGCELHLEHSLLSIDKWESKWHKPFIQNRKDDKRTPAEILDYIRCMTLNKVPEEAYMALTQENYNAIMEYINDPMTATTIRERKGGPFHNEIITSSLIYYWMIALQIPFSCEKWHINKLITLIKVCSAKNNPKKMRQGDILKQNTALNKARRKRLGTRG